MFNYVIATYGGVYRDNENKEHVLQQQLTALNDALEQLQASDGMPQIGQVTIVCPPLRHKPIPNYYQREKWEREMRVPIVFMDYVGQNKDHSYDQWIQAYEKYPNFDYYLLMEDDYSVHPLDAGSFTRTLQKYYEEKFPDGIGYLATLAGANNGHEHHAVISNGLVSRQTWERLAEPLRRYREQKLIQPYPQICFSLMFIRNGIDVRDFAKEYSSIFWNSDILQVIELSKGRKNRPLFAPVQYFEERSKAVVII